MDAGERIKFQKMGYFSPMSKTKLRVDCFPKAYVLGLRMMQS